MGAKQTRIALAILAIAARASARLRQLAESSLKDSLLLLPLAAQVLSLVVQRTSSHIVHPRDEW